MHDKNDKNVLESCDGIFSKMKEKKNLFKHRSKFLHVLTPTENTFS